MFIFIIYVVKFNLWHDHLLEWELFSLFPIPDRDQYYIYYFINKKSQNNHILRFITWNFAFVFSSCKLYRLYYWRNITFFIQFMFLVNNFLLFDILGRACDYVSFGTDLHWDDLTYRSSQLTGPIIVHVFRLFE